MNEKIIIQKLERADEILARMMHNVVRSEYDDYNRQLKKDAARLKSLSTEVELLIDPELIDSVQPQLQQHDVSGQSEQLPQLDDETVLEPMQNALYATNSFTTDQCSTLAEGILMYLKDAKMKIVPCGNCH